MNNKNVMCEHHPEQVLVGVCPYCLNQKLLAVAAERARLSVQGDGKTAASAGSIVDLPAKVFALGSLRSRLELRHRHQNRQRSYNGNCDGGGSSDPSSLEDSFISIKFEDNGVAIWDNSKASQDQSGEVCVVVAATTDLMGLTNEGNSGNNHAKAARVLLRWRKRIGLLLKHVKWKRLSNKGSGGDSHVDGIGRFVKGKLKGWKRALTMGRTNKE